MIILQKTAFTLDEKQESSTSSSVTVMGESIFRVAEKMAGK
jgi:hypothetical protein